MSTLDGHGGPGQRGKEDIRHLGQEPEPDPRPQQVASAHAGNEVVST